jgi:hypothetical protein
MRITAQRKIAREPCLAYRTDQGKGWLGMIKEIANGWTKSVNLEDVSYSRRSALVFGAVLLFVAMIAVSVSLYRACAG